MGFFGLFGKGAPTQKQIDKQVTHLKEQYAKPEYRQMAMDKLLEWNTKECLAALLNRFKVVVQSPYWDEKEKRWVVDQLVERGSVAREALEDFILKEDQITYAIAAYRRISLEEELIALLRKALEMRLPEDYRSSASKVELIAALEEYDSSDLSELLIPYLVDHHDDVQCLTLDVVARKKSERAYPSLLSMLEEESHSARVLRHTALKVAELELLIPENLSLAPEIQEDYVIKAGKLTTRR
ncbi:MAG: hypothetical protein I8H75_02000 [Myxococcaceae bacterium]|nr:hypothetical protein [Myxococcaceae bacterium]MBH2006108.1 hypothetical protein [Myxococcaceae bacterium]